MLHIRDLNSGYGKLEVLFDINLTAKEREITVVVGPNGAGKTTLLNSISGLATVHSGEILFMDKPLVGRPPYEIARMGVAYLPQLGNVFSELSVHDNLVMAGYMLRKKGKEELESRVDEVVEMFPILKQFIDRRAGTLSGGERRMLAIAMALLRRPKVMMLDEAATDLAPKIATQMMNKVIELRDELGMTIVLVEQSAKKALEIGDQAYLLVSGRILFEGKPEKLLAHPDFGKLYLGITPT